MGRPGKGQAVSSPPSCLLRVTPRCSRNQNGLADMVSAHRRGPSIAGRNRIFAGEETPTEPKLVEPTAVKPSGDGITRPLPGRGIDREFYAGVALHEG